MSEKEMIKTLVLPGIGLIVAAFITVAGIRIFNVWCQEMRGKAALAEASQSRKIQVEQAKAELESAKLRAKAIKIVGEMAKKYPEYRYQEYIGAFAEALKDGHIQQIIYVPTEAGIPLLEASRMVTGK